MSEKKKSIFKKKAAFGLLALPLSFALLIGACVAPNKNEEVKKSDKTKTEHKSVQKRVVYQEKIRKLMSKPADTELQRMDITSEIADMAEAYIPTDKEPAYFLHTLKSNFEKGRWVKADREDLMTDYFRSIVVKQSYSTEKPEGMFAADYEGTMAGLLNQYHKADSKEVDSAAKEMKNHLSLIK